MLWWWWVVSVCLCVCVSVCRSVCRSVSVSRVILEHASRPQLVDGVLVVRVSVCVSVFLSL
jgi:hypothetical protein